MNTKYFFKEIMKGKSLGRAMLFNALKNLINREKWLKSEFNILEIGHEPASYHRVLPPEWKIKSSNYKPAQNIDLIIDAEKSFLFKDNEFDGVINFNVLYILKNYFQCLSESLRISKKFILFNVPLICGLVPQPHDYNRFTKEKLVDIINKLKKEHNIVDYKIIGVGGTFTTAMDLVDYYLRFRIIKIPFYLLALFLDKLDKLVKRECPYMYIVLIRKK